MMTWMNEKGMPVAQAVQLSWKKWKDNKTNSSGQKKKGRRQILSNY